MMSWEGSQGTADRREKKRAMSMTGTGTWSVKRMQTDIRRIMSIMQRDFCMQRQT